MSKLYSRLFAVLFAIGCCTQGWAQLTIDPACPDETVQCIADLYDITCPADPIVFHEGDELQEPCGDVECTLVREITENKVTNIATTAMPNSGSEAGALVLYNIGAYGVASEYYVPTSPTSLQLDQYENGKAILHGTVQGVSDPAEQWEVFIVYEGETTDDAHVAGGGGLKYDGACAPIDETIVDWDIYYMNGGMSYLMGQGDLEGSLLSLNHAPSNLFFGFQVGEGGNDRNCNYGAGGWFSWSGTILGSDASGAMGDVLVDLDPSQADYDPCTASVTCICIGTDEDDNIFQVFECRTERNDDTPPVFDNAPANLVLECTQPIPPVPTVTATDNCEPAPNQQMITAVYQGEATVSYTAPGCYVLERTWTATDACNNTATHTQTITIQDTLAPTWDDYEPYVMESCLVILTEEEAEDPTLVPISASDACDGVLDYSIEAHEISGGCPTTWLRKWTATDDCGNTSVEVEQYVQLYDDTPPAITAPATATIYLDSNCDYNADPSVTGLPTYSDHCTDQSLLTDNLTYTDVVSASTCDADDNNAEGSKTITRTWKTTDYCLNSNEDIQIIYVVDNTAPEGEVFDVVLDCGEFDCEAEFTGNGAPTASDNCDSDVANSWVNLHCVTFTFTMDYWVPVEGMVILSESGETVAAGDFSEFAGSVDWVNGGEVSETLMLEPGAYSIQLTDSYGDGWVWNSVDGTDALVITYETLEMESAIAIDFTDGDSVSEDFDLDDCGSRCGPEHPEYENSPEGEEHCYFRERLYTFVDDCDNSSTQIQRLYLNDDQAPTFDGETTVTIDCAEYNGDVDDYSQPLGLTNVTDNCANDDDITITYTDVGMSGGCVTPIGMYERTYTISDECGNEVNFTQFVTLTDNEAPTLSIVCPAEATVYSDGYCEHDRSPSATNGEPAHTVDDNCDADVNIQKTYVDGPDMVVCNGHLSFTRTWTVMAIDHCFNFTTKTCQQTINVMDNTPPSLPSITCPADAVLEVDDECYANTSTEVTGEATAVTMDNCDDSPEMDIWHVDSAPEYTCEPDEASAFMLSASLGANEDATATVNEDLVAVGLHLELDWSSDGCTEWPSDLSMLLTSPDGQCVSLNGSLNSPAAGCEALSYPISWNTTTPGLFILDLAFANDLTGNGEWSLNVLEDWDGACGVSFDLEATLIRRAEGDYHFTRTWYAQATDCAGNESLVASCDQLISVEDNIAPTFDPSSLFEVDVYCDEYEEDAIYDVSASDNCDSNVEVEVLYNVDCDGDLEHGYSNDEVSGTCAGTYLRTYLATDDCGNTTTFEQIIKLHDETAPTISLDCPADITISKDENCFANDTRSGAGELEYEVTDNCSVDSTCVHVTDSEPIYTCEHSYYFTRTWEVEAWDACENYSVDSCSQLITVVDDSAPAKPIINCPTDVTRYRNDDCYTNVNPHVPVGCGGTGVLTIDYPIDGDLDDVLVVDHDQIPDGPGADCIDDPAITTSYYDNCSDDADLEAYISYSDTPVGDVNCTHYIERHWTAYFIDECGNQSETAECTQIINIIDDIDPVITAPDIDVDCETFHADPDYIFATVADNCDPNATLELIDQDMIMPGTCAGLFYNTYRATDCSGNTSTTSHYVTLIDNVAPTFATFPADAVVECGDGTTPADLGMPTVNDNCAANETLEVTYEDIVSTFKDDDCQTIERHWRVEDPCGNYTVQIQTYEIEDTGYPVITTPACDHTFQCDGEGNMAEFQNWLDTHAGAEATDDCSSIIWDYEVPVDNAGPNPALSDGCGASGEVTVTFYATDACGNSTPTTATFTVVDTIAPALSNLDLPDDVTLQQTANCDRLTGVNITGVPSANAVAVGDDVCCYNFVNISHEDGAIICLCEPDDGNPAFPVFTDDELGTGCMIAAEIDGTVSFDWAYNTEDIGDDGFGGAFFDVAIYVNGVMVELISDELGGDVQTGSLSYDLEAGDELGFGIFSSDGVYGGASLLISNFSGPSGQDFIGVYDEEEWDIYNGYNGSHTFSNDGETLLIEGTNVDLDCQGSYFFTRTWTLVAFDECGNESEPLIHEQVITVVDEIAPQFTNACGINNGDDIEVDYNDPFGNCDIPAPCPLDAADNCDDDVYITCTVDTIGEYAPTGNVANYSLATTPAAHQYGETCNGMDPHALRLMNLPNGDIYYDILGEALMTELETGEVMLTCSLESHNFPGSGFNMTLTLLPEAMAADIVDDEGLGELCLTDLGDLVDLVSCNLPGIGSDFPKYIVDCRDGEDDLPLSRLTGYGSYAGSDLALSHQPTNSYYGFQIGEGANQQNANFGMSGWFFYSGHFLGQPVMSSGDLFCDLDCTLPWGITYCCTAIDDCENESEFCYTYAITGDIDNGDGPAVTADSGAGDHTPVVIGGAGDLTTGKTPIRVTNLQPNPTNDWSQLGFTVTENMRIRVDLVGMDGVLVAELYDGVAATGVNHTLDIEADGLSNGMYQIRLTSNDYLVVKKLLVND